MMRRSRLTPVLLATLASAACASRAPGTNPDDMSAAQHRQHADVHEQRAEKHEARYDPAAKEERPKPFGLRQHGGADEFVYNETVYNPTAVHLQHAAEHREHARQHRDAARELEQFSEAECKSFPPSTRPVCPLLHVVERVEDVKGGARLHLASGVSAEAVLAHMRCHHAFGRMKGFEKMPACPLYLKGITLSKEEGASRTVDIKGSDEPTVAEIRKRSREHVGQ